MTSTSLKIERPGLVRGLRPSEMSLFRDHLLRLDAESRRDRFNGTASDAFIMRYAERCLQDGTTVVGYVQDGRVLAAAELHERPDLTPPTGEIAFSVERELQHRGLGGLLFQRLIAHARALGYTRLRVTTHPQNRAMRSLAARFNARLSFEEGETVGLIELSPDVVEPDLSPLVLPSLSQVEDPAEVAA